MSATADVTVRAVITEGAPSIDLEPTVERAAAEMWTHSVRRLVVTDGTEPVDVVSERTLLAAQVYRTDESAAGARREVVTAMETAAAGTEPAGDRFQDQSICEGCGTLASDLVEFNGQLLCPECREL